MKKKSWPIFSWTCINKQNSTDGLMGEMGCVGRLYWEKVEGDKYRGREEGKVTVRMSGKVKKNGTINCQPRKIYSTCKSVYKYTYIVIHKYIYIQMKLPIWTDNASSLKQRISSKIPNTKHEKPSFELLVRVVQGLPKQYKLFLLCLLTPRSGIVSLYCWTTHFRHRAQRPLGWNWPERVLPEDIFSIK